MNQRTVEGKPLRNLSQEKAELRGHLHNQHGVIYPTWSQLGRLPMHELESMHRLAHEDDKR